VITSHDPTAGLAEADLVLALKAGRPMFVGAPDQLERRRLREIYA
jgi:ABC-type cobalamin/Fe3+-siderophores transport system ATPase subunit